ncbi:MAG: sulfotransferase domain-containing protein [Alphaproteobacteria bacterium]|nr:sulfotransferase domain-containing protein [Alphaproteobacteria bacterium]
MALPTFMIVGAQKAGTTWAFECLNEHPQVCMPSFKEVHFFDRPEDSRFSRRDKGIDWYLSLFSDDAPCIARGEATPDYMFYPHVPAELHALNPALRIVFMLREPGERAYSAYWMQRRHRTDPISFADELAREPDHVERGLYQQQIDRFLALFPREQLRVYIYEEVTADPDGFMADLFTFIGADPAFRPAALRRRVGGTRRLSPFAGFLLYKVVSPVINHPAILPAWRWLRRNVIPPAAPASAEERGYPPMSPEDRRLLDARFHAGNERLFAFLGRDVPAWRH